MRTKNSIGFIYTIEHIGLDGKVKSVDVVKNLIPTVGLNHILSVTLLTAAQYSNWYLGLYTEDRTPVPSDTLTTLIADCGESAAFGSASRQLVTFPAASAGSTSTSADPNIFTAASPVTITGGFIASGITIGSSSGLLISAAKFTSPKILEAGELLRVPVGISIASI